MSVLSLRDINSINLMGLSMKSYLNIHVACVNLFYVVEIMYAVHIVG